MPPYRYFPNRTPQQVKALNSTISLNLGERNIYALGVSKRHLRPYREGIAFIHQCPEKNVLEHEQPVSEVLETCHSSRLLNNRLRRFLTSCSISLRSSCAS